MYRERACRGARDGGGRGDGGRATMVAARRWSPR
jgi:hypothetical protein